MTQHYTVAPIRNCCIGKAVPTLLTLFVNALPPGARRMLVRADPGLLRTARGARAMFAFVLTMAVTVLAGGAFGAPVTAFLIAFPVTVFSCAAISDDETRARIGKILALSASAGAMFTLSALLHTSWINHFVFVLLIGAVAYARQFGGPWIPVGLAANVSYFFGAFLKPDTQTLHWQWVGVVIGAVCALIVHQLVVPHRPWRRMRWAVSSIRMRMGGMLEVAARFGETQKAPHLKRELARVANAVNIAENELDNLPGGRLAHRPLAEALLSILALAERFALQLQDQLERVGMPNADKRELESLSKALIDYTPLSHNGDLALIGSGIDRLEQALLLPPDLDAARSRKVPPAAPVRAQFRSAIQSAAAAALAILGGVMLSPERWYWAVITVFVMFTGTFSRGQALAKSLQRTFGTLAGILVAMGVVWALQGNIHVALALMPLAIFCVFYAFTQSYTWMAFWITVTVALLFLATGRFTDALMVLRLEETAIGATAGIIVAAFVLPKSTDAYAREQLNDLLDTTRAVLETSLPDGPIDRLQLTAALHDFEAKVSNMRDVIEPLRIFPGARASGQRDGITRQLVLTSYWVHEIALAVRELDSAGVKRSPARALEASAKLEAVIERLRVPGHDETAVETADAPPPLARETGGDPMQVIATACHGAAVSLTSVARLVTDRSMHSRAFRF